VKDCDLKLLANISLSNSEKSGFSSYFGSSLAAIDIDNDGLDELFVGAPRHVKTFSRQILSRQIEISQRPVSGLIDVGRTGDEGRVYLYKINDAETEVQ